MATAVVSTATAQGTIKVRHKYFPAFDVFRGVGIVFVVLAHTPIRHPFFAAITPIGALGVHMFFALSGFLITYRLLEEHAQTGAIHLKAFYRRRVRRILPPALLYLGVIAVVGPMLGLLPTSPKEILACLFFYRNLYQPAMPSAWYTAHFWSLSIEEQFYLFWPFFLILWGPAKRRARIAALALIVANVIWRAYVI